MDSIALVGAAADYRYVQLRKLWTEEPGRMVRVSLRTAESAPAFRRLGTVPRRTLPFDMGAGIACGGGVARASLRPTASQGVASRTDAVWRVVVLFVLISFLLWTAQHSIYRYLVPLDLLTGALIVGFLRKLCPPRFAIALAALVAVALISTTRLVHLGRIDLDDRWVQVG